MTRTVNEWVRLGWQRNSLEASAPEIETRLPVPISFLVTEFGRPFAVAGFGNWFREQCDMANLRHCSFHGLRKSASVRLAEAGCTPHEIAAITGHASLKEIVRYTNTVDRKRLARAAIEKVKAETSSVKPVAKFDKKRKKS